MRSILFGRLSCRFFLFVCFVPVFFSSCSSDEVSDDALYTFVGETVYSYCKERSEFSIFTRLMEDTGTDKLLSCYGHYTCFVPPDTAFQTYFAENGIVYDSLSVLQKRNILYNHIISDKSQEYDSERFEVGALPTNNLNEHRLVVSMVCAGDTSVYVDQSKVLTKDNEVHNGIIHTIGEVIVESSSFLLDVLKQNTSFSLFSEVLEKTRLSDSLLRIADNSYVYKEPGSFYDYPKFKRYGYTVFAETDEVFREAGIQTLSDLIAYSETYYGTKNRDDYTSRENALNKFVSYHLLDRAMSTNEMVYDGLCTAPDYKDQKPEYYETMLKYRLMEVLSGNRINRQKDGSYVALDDYQCNLKGVNGYVHTLKNVLVYDKDVMEGDVLNKRIRIDLAAVAPHFTNNGFRWGYTDGVFYGIPKGYCDDYFTCSSTTVPTFCGGVVSWSNYEGNLLQVRGAYDFTLKMLPIPPGTYEVRLGYVAWTNRGITQLFFDNRIVGIPLDMSKYGGEEISWVADAQTDDGGTENDKIMRNFGYMKGPSSVMCQNGTITMRDQNGCLRYIFGMYVFQDYGYHTLRAKNVEDPNLIFCGDYMEFVPKNCLATEGKD